MDSNRHYIIYKTINLINDKIYIGKHITENINDDYLGSSKALTCDMNKYGKDKFKKEILFTFDNEQQMNEMESKIVDEDFLSRSDVYNLNTGGNGGWTYVNNSELSKQYKIKGGKVTNQKNKKNKVGIYDPIVRYLAGKYGFLGKHHTEEAKRRIGEKTSITQRGINNSQYGAKWMYNLQLKKSRTVKKEKIQEYINKGWIIGRKKFGLMV